MEMKDRRGRGWGVKCRDRRERGDERREATNERRRINTKEGGCKPEEEEPAWRGADSGEEVRAEDGIQNHLIEEFLHRLGTHCKCLGVGEM